MPRATRPVLELYHTTSYGAVETIARDGLDPKQGGALFRHAGYGARSAGKVFLAEGRAAALAWYGKIQDMLADRAGDDAAPEDVVPVLLAVTLPEGVVAQVDDMGARDVLGDEGAVGSWFVTERIPPEHLAYWDPAEREWFALEDWAEHAPGVELGIAEVEFFDEDGDPTDEANASSSAITVFGPYDSGGFKPDRDDDAGWNIEGAD